MEIRSIYYNASLGLSVLLISAIWVKVSPTFLDVALFSLGLLFLVYFPGRFVVFLLSIKCAKAEKVLLSLLAGMTFSSSAYWFLGVNDQRQWLWPVILASSFAGSGVAFKEFIFSSRKLGREGRGGEWSWLGVLAGYLLLLLTLILSGYFDAFRYGKEGTISVSTFPDDGLFHAGIVYEILRKIPPSSPMISGYAPNYSYFMDVLAAFFHHTVKIEVPHLLYIFLPIFFFALLVLAISTSAAAINGSRWAGFLCSFIVLFCGGMFNPIAGLALLGWEGGRWELIFHASTIVPLFFINPMLPALCLFYGGLLCIQRAFVSSERGWALMAGLLTAALVQYKIFGSAVILIGIFGAFILTMINERRIPRLFPYLAVMVIALPFFFYYGLVKAEDTHVVTKLEPGSPFFFTMAYLGLDTWLAKLKNLFHGPMPLAILVTTLFIGPLHVMGSLGIKVFALPSLIKGLIPGKSTDTFQFFLGCSFFAGVLGTYLFSVTPRDLASAYNNSVWFFAFSLHIAAVSASGVLLSFLCRFKRMERMLVLLIPISLSVLSTVQFLAWSGQNKKVYEWDTSMVKALEFLRDKTAQESLIIADLSDGQWMEDTLFISGLAGRRLLLSGSYLVAYQAPVREIAARREAIRRFFLDPCKNGKEILTFGPNYVWRRSELNGRRWGDLLECRGFTLKRVYGGEDVDIHEVIYVE